MRDRKRLSRWLSDVHTMLQRLGKQIDSEQKYILLTYLCIQMYLLAYSVIPFGFYFVVTLSCQRVGALVLLLWETTHVQEVVGSNSGAIFWIDMKFFHIDM